MRYGILIFGVAVLLLYNTYYENRVMDIFYKNQKYWKMASIAFTALSLYVFIRKHPDDSSSMIKHAAGMVQYLPIDRNSKDLITPLLDLTKHKHVGIHEEQRPYGGWGGGGGGVGTSVGGEYRGQGINIIPHKRSVSETKKKYVASQQNWSCNHCGSKLDATFEVDHVIELQDGGTNDVSNLTALCRNCHGKKSLLQRM